MIKHARLKKHLTQKELGAYIGVTQSYVCKIENRKTQSLSIAKVLELSSVLELDPIKVFIFLTDDCCSICQLKCQNYLKSK